MRRKLRWTGGFILGTAGFLLGMSLYVRAQWVQKVLLRLIVNDLEKTATFEIGLYLPTILITLGFILLIINWWNGIKEAFPNIAKDPQYDWERLTLLALVIAFAIGLYFHDKGGMLWMSFNHRSIVPWFWMYLILLVASWRSFLLLRRSP